jgi:hypothetical protein
MPLFAPAFNMWHRHATGPPPHLPRAYGSLVMDGTPIDPDVVATAVPFEVAGARFNPVTATRRPVQMTVWGLWKLLDPLPHGSHVLRLSGGDGHGFTVDVTYDLDVA